MFSQLTVYYILILMQSVFSALLLIKIEWCRYYNYSHFTEEKAETQEVGQLPKVTRWKTKSLPPNHNVLQPLRGWKGSWPGGDRVLELCPACWLTKAHLLFELLCTLQETLQFHLGSVLMGKWPKVSWASERTKQGQVHSQGQYHRTWPGLVDNFWTGFSKG